MIAAFPQLNFKIVEICIVRTGRSEALDEHVFIFFVKSSVNCFLDVSHFNVDDGLLKRGNGLLNVFFHSTQHVRLQDLVETLNLLLRRKVSKVPSEVLITDKLFGMNVIEETPEFTSVVLNGSSC
jgi:hypothetical protein